MTHVVTGQLETGTLGDHGGQNACPASVRLAGTKGLREGPFGSDRHAGPIMH